MKYTLAIPFLVLFAACGTKNVPSGVSPPALEARSKAQTTLAYTGPAPTAGGSSVSDGGAAGWAGCLQGWRGTACGTLCTQQTQWDLLHCSTFLDCYVQNQCGPQTCGGQDDVCGVNKFSYGTAPKTIADQVYNCLGCSAASPPACATANITASNNPNTSTTVDGTQSFSPSVTFTIPPLLTVVNGSAGNSTATLKFKVAGACSDCWQKCSYKGLASSSHPTSVAEIALGRIYGIQQCDPGINPAVSISVTALVLHLNGSDPFAGTTVVQLITPCATSNPVTAGSVPGGLINGSAGGLPPTPETPGHTVAGEPSFPEPYIMPSNPEVNGQYVPVANPQLTPVEISL
jgi:hypothetical protein